MKNAYLEAVPLWKDKSFLTNFVSCLTIGVGLYTPVYKEQILDIGLYAFSGAITNWLAIFMLFEKVPYLYGSGVIPNQFEEFKRGIQHLIMSQFFTQQNLERFFKEKSSSSGATFNPKGIIESLDYELIFQKLVNVIMSSSFGGMLAMFGGASALTPLKPSVIANIKETVQEILVSPRFQETLQSQLKSETFFEDIREKIDHVVVQRLNELTPQMVKEIIQEMIQKHLGWLVVWGGVFGGFIGLVASYL